MAPVMTITPDALPRHFWLYVGHAGDYNRVFDISSASSTCDISFSVMVVHVGLTTILLAFYFVMIHLPKWAF